jgi:hypothetical protein
MITNFELQGFPSPMPCRSPALASPGRQIPPLPHPFAPGGRVARRWRAKAGLGCGAGIHAGLVLAPPPTDRLPSLLVKWNDWNSYKRNDQNSCGKRGWLEVLLAAVRRSLASDPPIGPTRTLLYPDLHPSAPSPTSSTARWPHLPARRLFCLPMGGRTRTHGHRMLPFDNNWLQPQS